MRAIAATAVVVLLLAGCSRGDPEPAPSATATPTSAVAATDRPGASEGVSEGAAASEVAASEGASEGPTEPTRIAVPLTDLLTMPRVSGTAHWLRVGPVRRRDSFAQWLTARQVEGEAATLAQDMDERYGFNREVEVAFVHRRGARSAAPRTRQLLISSFDRTDKALSEAWCSVDEQGAEAVDLGSSKRVSTAVDALVALPGSCGAVRRLPGSPRRFRADISFRHGPLMVQVVAVEAKPVTALEGIAAIAPALHRQIVSATG